MSNDYKPNGAAETRVGEWTTRQRRKMDARFCAAVRRAAELERHDAKVETQGNKRAKATRYISHLDVVD
jgi:hypothetical protein